MHALEALDAEERGAHGGRAAEALRVPDAPLAHLPHADLGLAEERDEALGVARA